MREDTDKEKAAILAATTDRYVVFAGSESAHCCFDATIIDREAIGQFQDGSPYYNEGHVAECFDIEAARRIAALLNAATRPQRPPRSRPRPR